VETSGRREIDGLQWLMTITHQILTDAEGKPVAAQIPWAEFEVIKAELERDLPLDAETRSMLDRRSQELEDGTVEGLDSEEMFRRVRERLDGRRIVIGSA
jgi:hypothetical protein